MRYYEEEMRDIFNENGTVVGSIQLAIYYEGYEEHFDREFFEYEEIENPEEARADFVLVMGIDIDEDFRNQGIGTKTLRALAEEFGYVYLRPENARCKHLYRRIGYDVSYDSIPKVIQCEADNAYPYDDNFEVDEKLLSGLFLIR